MQLRDPHRANLRLMLKGMAMLVMLGALAGCVAYPGGDGGGYAPAGGYGYAPGGFGGGGDGDGDGD